MTETSKLVQSMTPKTSAEIDKVRAEQILKDVRAKTGQNISLEQLEEIKKEAQKKAKDFEEKTKSKSVAEKDLIGAAEYKKDSDKLNEGDIIGQLRLQAAAAAGMYGPAKCQAAIAKFGTGFLASSSSGWAGFILNVANSSGLTDRIIQSVTGSEAADDIVENQAAANKSAVATPRTPAANTILAQHATEHANTAQVDSLAIAKANQSARG